ncbi:MAG: hypothetical protein RR202_09120 [Bacteroidales bacterium]
MNTLKTLVYAIVALVATLFSSCTGKSDKSQTAPEAEVIVYNIDDLLEKSDSLKGQTVQLEGVCTHVCERSGKKLFLMGSDEDHTIRVEANGEIGTFNPESVNNIVLVKGKLVEERIDEAYLADWEAQLAADTAEKHGNEGEGGCSTEKKARGEGETNTTDERITEFRNRIADREAKEGKNYLSFYHVVADSYEVK